jgi:hypothetical protein
MPPNLSIRDNLKLSKNAKIIPKYDWLLNTDDFNKLRTS